MFNLFLHYENMFFLAEAMCGGRLRRSQQLTSKQLVTVKAERVSVHLHTDEILDC